MTHKKVLSLILLFCLTACVQEEIESFDDLTPAEQEAVRQNSYNKCKSAYTNTFERFKDQSNEVFSSGNYDREDGFYHEYKKESSTDANRTLDIRVWKRDATAGEIYFYITETQLGSSSYFLRVTQSENEAMIDDLLEDHCTKPAIYTSSTSDNGPLSVGYEFNVTNAPNTDNYVDTYSLPFSELAYFSAYRISRKLTTKDSDGDIVGSEVSYTSTLVSKTYDFGSYSDYSDNSQYTQKFCYPDKELNVLRGSTTLDAYRFSNSGSILGFKLTCVDSTLPVGWNLAI